jgi:hypothetical protein
MARNLVLFGNTNSQLRSNFLFFGRETRLLTKYKLTRRNNRQHQRRFEKTGHIVTMISKSIMKNRPFSHSVVRRSARPLKRRDYYLTEFQVGRKLLYKTDNERGLNQPGGTIWTQKELHRLRKSHMGVQLFKQHLTEAKWKWKHSKLGEYGHIYIAPNIPKENMVKNINYFTSYVDIYDQYCKDGSIIEKILKRGSKFAGCSNPTKHEKSKNMNSTNDTMALKSPEPDVNTEHCDICNMLTNSDKQDDMIENESVCKTTTKDLAIVSPPRAEHQETRMVKEIFTHRIIPDRSPVVHEEDGGTEAVFSIDLHTVAPDEIIIPRLERIEYTLGFPRGKYSYTKIFQRLAMLEEDCGVEVTLSLPTTAKTSFLRRVELLENVVGI